MTASARYRHLGYLQFNVVAGDLEVNLDRVRNMLEHSGRTGSSEDGLLVMPELWSSGFDYRNIPAIAARTPEVLDTLAGLARQYRLTLAGSLPEQDGRSFYNTLFVTGPTGQQGFYRKQRLFVPMDEDSFFTPGSGYAVIDTPMGKLASLVCYDLRFPELARTQTAEGADFLVIAAQWPKVRREHWQVLVQARAIENQLFVIACNRCGATGNTEFAGHSMIVAPDGEILHEAGEEEELIMLAVDPAMNDAVRNRFAPLLSKKIR